MKQYLVEKFEHLTVGGLEAHLNNLSHEGFAIKEVSMTSTEPTLKGVIVYTTGE